MACTKLGSQIETHAHTETERGGEKTERERERERIMCMHSQPSQTEQSKTQRTRYHTFSNALVFTDVCIPDVLLTSLGPAFTCVC